MINIMSKSNCNGCGACWNVCPVKAISFDYDNEGFLYPEVDNNKCIKCMKCVKSCPISCAVKSKNINIATYAAWSKDDDIRLNSSSGGVFAEIATRMIEKNGVVFGAAFDKNFKVIHIAAESLEELKRMQGSKYVQSEIGSSYGRAKEYLEAGRMVLFTGTPCQIGGLYSYLNKDYENLYTQDIVCHGVPSPMVWEKYIEYREKKSGSKIKSVFFRYKEHGWKKYSLLFKFTNETTILQSLYDDLYMRSFLKNISLRPSCYNCYFKAKDRLGDCTLADFWGIENINPQLDDDKGVSLVAINSEKGKKLFADIENQLEFCAVDFDEAIKYNTSAVKSAPINMQRDEFFYCMRRRGFCRASKKFLKTPLKKRLSKFIKKVLRKV